MNAEECAAAAELHDQGLISGELLARINASLNLSEGTPPVQSVSRAVARSSRSEVASTSRAAVRLREGVISFPVFVRAHLLQLERRSDGVEPASVEEASIFSRLDACCLAYLRGNLEAFKTAADSLGAQLLASRPAIVEGPAGGFQSELTTLLEGLVWYYLGSTHWNRPDDVLQVNSVDVQDEVSVAAEAAHAAMSKSWAKLKRSVWAEFRLLIS